MDRIINILTNLKGDKYIWLIFGLLSLASMVAVYSSIGAVAYQYTGGNTEFYLFKQLFFILLGFGVATLAYRLEYMWYGRFAGIFLWFSVVLLVITLFWGPEYNDARRWINIPWINQRFQTSDLAKVALVVYIARSLAIKQDYIKDFKGAFLPIILPVLLVCGLIMPADFSTAALLFATSLMMMFIGRVSLKYVGLLLVLGLFVFMLLFLIGQFFPDIFRVDTWVSRVQDFMSDNDGSWQVQQSKIAIARGGFFGVGPGNSIQKNFLPFAYADFIYAIICEEWGLIGGILLLFLYLLLLVRCIKIVTLSPKAFGAILAMGLCLQIVIQAFANISVSVQLVPVTGLTLPMVSMGGTSMVLTSFSIGVILSVSRYVEQAQKERLALEKLEARENESNH